MRQGKFEYWRTAEDLGGGIAVYGDWYWHLKAANGRIICQSEGYKTKAACLNGIRSVQRHAWPSVLAEL